MWHREMFRDAYHYFKEALRLGQEVNDSHVVGYACTWLAWTCVELGRLQEALDFAEKAQKIVHEDNSDQDIYFNSLAAFGNVNWRLGRGQNAYEAGSKLIEFGRHNLNIPSMVMGHCCQGFKFLVTGDLAKASSCFEEAIAVSADPWYAMFPKLALCYSRIVNSYFNKIDETLWQIIHFSDDHGAEYIGTPSKVFLGVLLAAKGDLRDGMKLLKWGERTWKANGCRVRRAECVYILARLHARIGQRRDGGLKKNFNGLRNFVFLLINAPFARRRAIHYYLLVIQEAQ